MNQNNETNIHNKHTYKADMYKKQENLYMTPTKEELQDALKFSKNDERVMLDNKDGITFSNKEKAEIKNFHKTVNEALTAQLEAGWQPIETAPKDGEWVLIYDKELPLSSYPAVAFWDESFGGMWVTVNHDTNGVLNPTHWMPLPPAPDVTDTNVGSIPEAIEKQGTTTTPTEQQKES